MPKKLYTKIEKKSKLFESLYEWETIDRPWRIKDRIWYLSYGLFFILLIALAALLQEFILIVAIIAFVFLWFTQAAVPPEKVKYTITSLGVKAYGKLYKWKSIKFFWFSEKENFFFLNLDILDEEFTSGDRVHRASLIVEEKEMNTIFDTLVKFVDYGDTDEVNFNIITRLLNGRYIDISTFLSTKEGGDREEQTDNL